MFLNELPEEKRNTFLNMAYTLISADGVFTDVEMQTLQLYTIEFNIEQLPELSTIDYDKALAEFADLPLSMRKKVYFELYSLAFADSNCSNEEKVLLNKAATHWEIPIRDVEELESITRKLLFDYEQLGYVING